jgi:Flp pilus assembly pilin Flp
MFRMTKTNDKKNTTQLAGGRRRRGQGMTEYIVIVGLIALVLVGAIGKFKDALGTAFGNATSKINGVAVEINNGGSATANPGNPGQ